MRTFYVAPDGTCYKRRSFLSMIGQMKRHHYRILNRIMGYK